jgi:hypothetical protein
MVQSEWFGTFCFHVNMKQGKLTGDENWTETSPLSETGAPFSLQRARQRMEARTLQARGNNMYVRYMG